MPTRRGTEQLARYQARYQALAEQVAEIGFIASGSVALRYNRCGKTTCACHADPPRLHGPYWQWTAKVNGKTVNRRLSESDARRYQTWIANDRTLRALINDMRTIAAKATQLILTGAADPPPEV
jgi:hypothetical protein